MWYTFPENEPARSDVVVLCVARSDVVVLCVARSDVVWAGGPGLRMAEGQKIVAEGYGDMVIQRLHGLRRNMELCDFKVSADGRVFEVGVLLKWQYF